MQYLYVIFILFSSACIKKDEVPYDNINPKIDDIIEPDFFKEDLKKYGVVEVKSLQSQKKNEEKNNSLEKEHKLAEVNTSNKAAEDASIDKINRNLSGKN